MPTSQRQSVVHRDRQFSPDNTSTTTTCTRITIIARPTSGVKSTSVGFSAASYKMLDTELVREEKEEEGMLAGIEEKTK